MGLKCTSIIVLACSLVCVGLYAAPPDVMRVHFINVGQGAATLIEFPYATMLVDTGGERTPSELWREAQFDSTKELKDYLASVFQNRPNERLTLLALTHPHLDHTRGVGAVIEKYKPLNIIHNGQRTGSGSPDQMAAMRYVRDSDAKGYYILERRILNTGFTNDIVDPIKPPQGSNLTDPKIRVLWGQVERSLGWEPGDFGDENNHSLVIRIDFGTASLLITGDLEEAKDSGNRAGIERLIEKYRDTDLLDTDVYLLGHHGSHNGNTKKLVEAITPKIAVIAVGPAERQGEYTARTHCHPREQTLDELLSVDSLTTRTPKTVTYFKRHSVPPSTRTMEKAIYATGWDGNIVLEAKPNGEWKLVP